MRTITSNNNNDNDNDNNKDDDDNDNDNDGNNNSKKVIVGTFKILDLLQLNYIYKVTKKVTR